MSTVASRRLPTPTPSRLFAYASFAIMVSGWLAFAVALMASQHTLDEVWSWVGDRPLLVEGVIWLLGFPFLIGLAIWQAPWDDIVRLVAIAVLSGACTYLFVPRKRRA
jgi:hypothetical protein